MYVCMCCGKGREEETLRERIPWMIYKLINPLGLLRFQIKSFLMNMNALDEHERS